ncbi:MAG: PaaI family thioesterase [Acidimicrobiia bacterium]|nr:PaaI family thioesterase [Acidimicrobiia bacterium]
MSEAAPGLPDPAKFSTGERARLAEAARGLLDAVITLGDVPAAEIDAAASVIHDVTRRLGGNDKPAGAGYRPTHPLDRLPRSPFVGEANPVSPPAEWDVRGERVHATVTFGPIYEGPPGYVHGGFIAMAFDELLGLTNSQLGRPGMTGTLSIKYRNPTPLHREVRLESWVERMEGRRVVIRGELRHDDTLCAEAEGLFVALRPEVAAAYFAHITEA